jgi:hypothetical protein
MEGELDNERVLLQQILDWCLKRRACWGAVCVTEDGQRLDWGQAVCYLYYGPGWNDEDLETIPNDIARALDAWDDEAPPAWFVLPARLRAEREGEHDE